MIGKGCTGKVGYNTLQGAEKSAKEQRKKGRSLTPYRCFNCLKWHLTSMAPSIYLKQNKHITK